MTFRHALTVVVLLVGAGVLAAVITSACRRWLDWQAQRNYTPPAEEPFVPLYPPFTGEEESEVLEGHVVEEDDLGMWEPTAHPLLPALIADDLMAELPWQTLRRPPSWSAWTGAHPVVRLADLAEFGAVA